MGKSCTSLPWKQMYFKMLFLILRFNPQRGDGAIFESSLLFSCTVSVSFCLFRSVIDHYVY